MDAENDVLDGMYTEDVNDDSQEQTQSTQQASQPLNTALDEHLWGYLQPCSSALTRIDFWKIHPRYTIGRNIQENQVVLPGFKISVSPCSNCLQSPLYCMIQAICIAPSRGMERMPTLPMSSFWICLAMELL
jgi:hypothetical protein